MKTGPQHIVECFMLNWDLFGDDKSTEFLTQFTADQLGIKTDDVYAALEVSPHSSKTHSGDGK